MAAWLNRSTLPEAKQIRAFLNRSLKALPSAAAGDLCHRLRHAPPFEAALFELIVGRFLQVLGAELQHEPTGLDGSKLDWRATGAKDPTLYHHPRFTGLLPAELMALRRRSLEETRIREDMPATRARVADAIGFPSSDDY